MGFVPSPRLLAEAVAGVPAPPRPAVPGQRPSVQLNFTRTSSLACESPLAPSLAAIAKHARISVSLLQHSPEAAVNRSLEPFPFSFFLF